LGVRKSIQPVKKLSDEVKNKDDDDDDAGMVICL